MSLLDPVSHALATVVATAHHAVTALGADPDAGATWVVCVAVVVVVVRLAMLPLVVHGVRSAHAAARARPELQRLAKRYRGKTDAASLQAYAEERRRIGAEHGTSRLGCLPLLLQIPIWISLYHLIRDLADGTPVGAMDGDLVTSLGSAAIVGVRLADRGYLGHGAGHLAVVAGLAAVAAALSFLTQRYLVQPNTFVADLPEAMGRAQQVMPVVSAVGLLVAGAVVPLALVTYWVCSNVWTAGQSAVVYRWFPTPGTPAALRAARGGGAATTRPA